MATIEDRISMLPTTAFRIIGYNTCNHKTYHFTKRLYYFNPTDYTLYRLYRHDQTVEKKIESGKNCLIDDDDNRIYIHFTKYGLTRLITSQ